MTIFFFRTGKIPPLGTNDTGSLTVHLPQCLLATLFPGAVEPSCRSSRCASRYQRRRHHRHRPRDYRNWFSPRRAGYPGYYYYSDDDEGADDGSGLGAAYDFFRSDNDIRMTRSSPNRQGSPYINSTI
jgi:hypothetical protein